jgi:hypothetical protein
MLCNERVIIENVEFDSFFPPFTLLGHGQRYKIMSENYESKACNTANILFNLNTDMFLSLCTPTHHTQQLAVVFLCNYIWNPT